MSVLALSVRAEGVTTAIRTGEGLVAARAERALHPHSPVPGWSEVAPELVWQAVADATRGCLDDWSGTAPELTGIEITAEPATALLWDRETLGSPRPALLPGDRRADDLCVRLRAEDLGDRVRALSGHDLAPECAGPRFRWLAEHEPHTWALVAAGRYALGPLSSYLVARLTRGTWHVADVGHAGTTLLLDPVAGAWSPELCSVFDVPLEALPDLVPGRGRLAVTDPRSFLGLELPVTALLAHG